MINDKFKFFFILLLFGFVPIRPKTIYLVGISLKQISSFHLWTFKYKGREKWIIDKLSWIHCQKLKLSF